MSDALPACVVRQYCERPVALPPPVSGAACVSTLLDSYAPGGTSPLSLLARPHARGALIPRDIAHDARDIAHDEGGVLNVACSVMLLMCYASPWA